MLDSIKRDITQVFSSGNMVSKLLVVNIAVMVFLLLAKVFFTHLGWFDFIFNCFAMPGNLGKLMFRPWTILTYMFTHIGFWHIVWNLVALHLFGTIVGDLIGDKKVLPIYVLCGLGGALAFLLWSNIPSMLQFPTVHGASASVMGLAIVAAIIAPDYLVRLILLGDVKLKYIVLAFIFLDLIGLAGASNTGGHIAHVGGLLVGIIYMHNLNRGRDLSTVFQKFGDLFYRTDDAPKQRKPIMKVAYRSVQPKVTRQNAPEETNESELNRILDKIKTTGYENLTKKEKDFLTNASRD